MNSTSSRGSSFSCPWKKALVALGAVAAAPLGAAAAYRHYVHHRCARFLAAAEAAFDAPGLAENFVPQDLDYLSVCDGFVFSGYDGKGGPSPLYLCPKGKDPFPVFIELPDGSLYCGHGAAVAADGQRVLVTTATAFMALVAADLAFAEPNERLRPVGHRFVDLTPAFMGIYDDILYLGAYYYPVLFNTPGRMHVTTPDGQKDKAVMYAFHRDETEPCGFASEPFAVYALPKEVQGMAALPDGRFVFSCSVGFVNSHLRIYDSRSLAADGTYLAQWHVVPRYDLDDRTLVDTWTVPPMSEGITLHDDALYVPFEAASTRYRIGALTGGKHVYRLPLSAFDGQTSPEDAS